MRRDVIDSCQRNVSYPEGILITLNGESLPPEAHIVCGVSQVPRPPRAQIIAM